MVENVYFLAEADFFRLRYYRILEEISINYKLLYEQEVTKNARLEERYAQAVKDKAQAERKSIDVINEYEGILLELEQIREAYREAFASIMKKRDECEYMRRSLVTIMKEIKKCDPRKIGADIELH